MCTGVSLLATNVSFDVQGMDLMVLQQRAEGRYFPDTEPRLVLVHLDHSAAAAQPTLTVVSKV